MHSFVSRLKKPLIKVMLLLLHFLQDLFAEETINPNIHKSQWIQSWFCKARQYHWQNTT